MDNYKKDELVGGSVVDASTLESDLATEIDAHLVESPLDPAEQYLSALPPVMQVVCLGAMRHRGMVLRLLGFRRPRGAGWFGGDDLFVCGDETYIVATHGFGSWESEQQDGPSGWTLLELAEHVWQVGRYAAAAKLRKFLQALEAREGLDEFDEFGLAGGAGGTGGQQLSSVPDGAPALPPTAGLFDEYPDDYPLHDKSGALVGYVRRIGVAGSAAPYSGLEQSLYLPLTCWQLPDGSMVWRNRALKGPLPLVGLKKLIDQPQSAVVLTDDERSAEWAEHELRDRGVSSVVGLSLMSRSGSLAETDLSPLGGKIVYVLSKTPGRAEAIQKRLWQANPRTKVSIVELGIDFAGKEAPPAAEGNFSAGWTLVDYASACIDWRWKLSIGISEPSGPPNNDYQFGDFYVSDDGVHKITYKDGVPDYRRIASRIDVEAIARSKDSDDWGQCLRFADPDNAEHRWCAPRSHLSSDSRYCNQLLRMGAFVSPFQQDRAMLTLYLLTAPVQRRARAVFQPGWDGNLFVFPDGSHAGHSDEMVSYQTTSPAHRTFSRQGSLEGWKCQVARYCEGNSRLALVVATALTGPVLPLLGEEGGGFHFTGDSSVGKTTGLHLACSVWGPPTSFVNSWRGTANGIEAKAVLHNHTLYTMDEMSQISPSEAGEVVYMLANGQGKLRAQQDGSSREAQTWQLMFLSTGEVGLEQHMASVGQRVMAGQQARLIDIVGDAGAGHGLFDTLHGESHGAELSVLLKQRAATYYGTAGRAWVEKLAEPERRATLLARIRATMEAFCTEATPEDAHGQVRRVIRRFGLVAAVAEVAAAEGILPWTQGEASSLIRRCATQWLQARGGAGNLEANQALTQLRRVLSEFGESGFTEIGTEGVETNPTRVTIRRLGFRQVGEDELTDFYFLPDAFKDVVCAGMNPRHATEQLKSVGALVLGPGGKAQVVKRLPGLGPTRVYHVRSTVLQQGLESVGIDPAS